MPFLGTGGGEPDGLQQKLLGLLDKTLAEHKAAIAVCVQQQIGAEALASRSDDAVGKLAVFLYDKLPGMVKMVASQDKFTEFALKNRELLVERTQADLPK